MSYGSQRGFAVIEIIIVVLVIVAIGGLVAWRFYASGQEAAVKNKENVVTGPLTQEDRKKLEETKAIEQQAASGTTQEQTQSSSTPQSQSGSTNGSSRSSAGTSGSSNGTSSQTAPSPAPTTNSTTSPPPPASTVTRPTVEWCAAQNGNSFTNVWVTDNKQHTYQVWENGGWVSKTETGTAARNFDSMQVVGVLPYLTQPSWAGCSQKAGYITVYYNPPGSVYTYNWLVAFGDISITHP